MKCSNCGFDNPAEMLFCGMCGTRLAQACKSCGFTNPAAFRYCGKCGQPLAAISDLPLALPESIVPPASGAFELPPPPTVAPLEGEKKVVTVLVTDMTGSTTLLERLGTEAWVDLMNRILNILEGEIYRFGGVVDQFRGDGLVAFFGVGSANEDDPERAILASLTMQQTIKRFASELPEENGREIQMRIGVNTGDVIVTRVGNARQHSEDTAMGMAIAVAARLEAAAQPGTVLVSESAHRQTATKFDWEALGSISVKGVSQPIAVYRPIGIPSGETQARIDHTFGINVPMVGREKEMRVLKSSVEDLYVGRGQIVTLVGDKGVGKTYLIKELQDYFLHQGALLAEAQDSYTPPTVPLTWINGRCRSFGQPTPYYVWRDLLFNWLGVRQGDSKEEIRDQLRMRCQEVWGDKTPEHYPYMASFLTLPVEEEFAERVRYLEAESLRQQFFVAVRSLLEGLSKKGPLVVVLRDMHWAGAASLDLLRYCLPLCDSETLLWVIIFRSERDTPIWEFDHFLETQYPHRLKRVELMPLNHDESRAFINSMIGPRVLPKETEALIINNSEGNPFYIQELIYSLVDQNILVRQESTGKWRLTGKINSLDLPVSLQTLLSSRIDRLAPDEKDVLQVASIIGSVFWFSVLQELVGENYPLKRILAGLQRAQIIQENGQVSELGMQYAFRSNLMRDAAYESMLSTQRSTYHLRIAEYIENNISSNALSGYDGLLTYHYRNAGRAEKELYYTLQAARQAQAIYANADALAHYNRAYELVEMIESVSAPHERIEAAFSLKFEILDGRIDIHYRMGSIAAGNADARALLPLAEKMKDNTPWMIDALLRQPEVTNPSRQQLEKGLEISQRALDLSRKIGARERELRSLMSLTNCAYLLRNPLYRETAQRALDLARELGDHRSEVIMLLNIGSAYGMDDIQRNMEYLEAALPILKQLDDKGLEIDVLRGLSEQYERSGDYYRQLTEFEQKRLQMAREIGERLTEVSALMFCGQLHGIYLGDYQGGLALLEDSLRGWEEDEENLFSLLRMAQIKVALGEYEEAEAILKRCHPLAEKNPLDIGRAGLYLVSAILANSRGDEGSLRWALELVSRIHTLAEDNLVSRQYQLAASCEATAAHLELARCLTDETESQFHGQQALECSSQAMELFERFGFVQIIECTSEEILYRHGLALQANGQPRDASELFQRAYDEMMRKHAMIPEDTLFKRTYLENIALHREIMARFQNPVLQAAT